MSMGGGGGQMPMASNRGQQQQQMMMGQPQGMMPQPMGQPMPPSGGMFGGQPQDQMQQMMQQQMQQQQMMDSGQAPYQMAQQVPASPLMSAGLSALLSGSGQMTQQNQNTGLPLAYKTGNSPIDGRQLRDMIDINRRRPMGRNDRNTELPGAIENVLPPSLKRPTQGFMGRLK
jgi:hypothetical protein